ncbi:KIR protein [Plasmodium coatneyi]|uniref:KIR protein n=1 Tax=Plasmodium coatneyi TaxID=208452 RepID=A0A1B1DW20_9APIC|nr:KIR protein [Plasmodium coatneyi]ANQ06950.1 KIR protein [Plasmodium coatneyi]
MGNEQQEQEQDQIGCRFHLPSEAVYTTFNNTTEECNNNGRSSCESVEKSLEHTCRQSENNPNNAQKILKGGCYAYKKWRDSSSDELRCNFLYYWGGSKLSDAQSSVQNFKHIMEAIYGNLEELGMGRGCRAIFYSGIDRDTFKNMKSVFDYTQDYSTIKKYARGSSTPGSSCAEKYANYLDKVLSAYDYMNLKCRSGNAENSESWCTQFNNMSANHTHEEVLKLKCLLKHTDECPILPGIINNISYGMLTTASILVTFFFYKYISLFPFPRRNSSIARSNKRRRGRGRFVLHKSDTEAENFTNYSTDYSTENSTLESGTADSTLGDSTFDSTAEYSTTVYNLPSRKTNNKQKQQKQQHNRNNIAYRRM